MEFHRIFGAIFLFTNKLTSRHTGETETLLFTVTFFFLPSEKKKMKMKLNCPHKPPDLAQRRWRADKHGQTQ